MRRPAYLAGSWYPDSEAACRAAIVGHAAEALASQGCWRGAIVPHAGWRYSGDAMGKTFRALAAAQAQKDVELVVVFGSHRGPQGPNTVFVAESWDTPLGPLSVAQDLARSLASTLDLAEEPVQPRRPDNGVEVLLPFVRHFFPVAELLMFGVAAAPVALEIGAEVGNTCAVRGGRVIYIGSTDLTHYGPNYDFAPQGHGARAVDWVRRVNDRGFIDAACRMDAATVLRHGVEAHSACCPGAAAAAMEAVRQSGEVAGVELVDHYLSYDVQPGDSYVGYAGLVF